MARPAGINTSHATLSTTVADTVALSGQGSTIAVTNRDASNTLYFALKGTNEVQTISLTAGAENDTFKLTWEGSESSAVTIPAGGFANVTAAQIATALDSITGITSTNVAVVKAVNDYTVTFGEDLRWADVGAITVTTKTGAADGSVAETTKGGITAAADETYVVLPLQTKTLGLHTGGDSRLIPVIGSGNAYSVEIF
jgi:hypothetical protein